MENYRRKCLSLEKLADVETQLELANYKIQLYNSNPSFVNDELFYEEYYSFLKSYLREKLGGVE